MSKKFDLEEYISSQVEWISLETPDPERLTRTFANIRHKTNISGAMGLGEGMSSVVMGGSPEGVFMHDGTAVPEGHALSVVIDTNEETDGYYTWASITTFMAALNGKFLRSLEKNSMQRMKALGHPDCDDPANSVLVVQEATAKALLKHSSGDMELSKKEQGVMADRLLDTTAYRLSDDETFCKVWEDAATGGMTLAMVTLFIGTKMLTTMIPLGKPLPDALAKEVYEEA